MLSESPEVPLIARLVDLSTDFILTVHIPVEKVSSFSMSRIAYIPLSSRAFVPVPLPNTVSFIPFEYLTN